MASYDFMIGTTQANMINLEELGTPVIPPMWTFTDFKDSVTLANGMVRGLGFESCTWHWDFLKKAERAQLRTYCSDKASEVYIQTPTNEAMDYEIYKAVMVWPDGEDPTVDVFLDFTIEFRRMVWVASPESV